MGKVIIHTMAYNAEGTIRRAIESVINQTCGEFTYYLCEHGSKDGTRDIVLEYAARDKRIVPILLDTNYYTSGEKGLDPFRKFISTTLMEEFEKGNAEYFCTLDADDDYKTEFLAKTLAFMAENELDIAACGTDLFQAVDGVFLTQRALRDDLILEETEAFSEYFTEYFMFFRAVWAKIFKISLLRQCDYSNYENFHKIGFGKDTLFSLRAFLHAGRVGVLAEPLHNYYLGATSISSKWYDGRIEDDRILLHEMIEVLKGKTGDVSHKNRFFVYTIYYHALEDTFKVLIHSQLSDGEKFEKMRRIIRCGQTREMIAMAYAYKGKMIDSSNIDELFELIQSWIMIQFFGDAQNRTIDNLDIAADIYSVADCIHVKPNDWSAAEYFTFIVKLNNKQCSDFLKKQVQLQICAACSSEPLLGGYNSQFLITISDIVHTVLVGDFDGALELTAAVIEGDGEVSADNGFALVSLGLNLAAQLERVEYFIFFKKMQISLLLDMGQAVDARAEIAQWRTIMPEDEEFAELARLAEL